MARPSGAYSQVVAWLKILLPLAALALMSTMFLLSRGASLSDQVPIEAAFNQDGTVAQGVGAPYYSSVTGSGDRVTLMAQTAYPMEDGSITADQLDARIQFADGSRLFLDALNATVEDGADLLTMTGGVRIESSVGYVMTTNAMTSALNQIEAETHGAVQGTGPAGTLEAGKMQIRPSENGEDVQILFTGGVKLVYQPPK
jgi:lipopolysaccharide export system protein LptC